MTMVPLDIIEQGILRIALILIIINIISNLTNFVVYKQKNSPKAQITFPRATKLRFILAPSLSLGRALVPNPQLSLPFVTCPMACALSLPARSTRCSRLQHPSGVEEEIVNTEWLLLERRLLEVAATRRFPLPAER